MSGVGLWLAARGSFYYADDYLNFARAGEHGFGFHYLALDYFGHFAPGHRVLDYLAATAFQLSWEPAVLVLLAFWLIAALAFHALCVELFGRRPITLLLTAMFASSVVFVRLMQWWANGCHVLPGIALTLVSLAGAIRWTRTRSLWTLTAAVVGYASSLCFYEKPALLLGYLFMIRCVLTAERVAPRTIVRRLREDALLWTLLLGATAVWLHVVSSGGYVPGHRHAAAKMWSKYLRHDWTRGASPLLLNQSVPATPGTLDHVTIVAAQLGLIGLASGSLLWSRNAWRAWAFYLIGWAVNCALIGYGRLREFGPDIALDLRFNAEIGFLLPLTLGFAFTSGGTTSPRWRQARAFWTPRLARVGRASAVVALVGWTLASAASYYRVATAWPARHTRVVVERLRASLAAMQAQGLAPSVIDGPAPASIVVGVPKPYSQLSKILPLIDPSVPINRDRGTLATVDADGIAHVAVLRTYLAATPDDLTTRGELHVVDGEPDGPAGPCYAPKGRTTQLLFSPSAPVHADGPVAMRIEMAPGAGSGRFLVFVDAEPGRGGSPKDITLGPADRGLIFDLEGNRFVPARVDIPPGSRACPTQISLVGYR